MVCLISTDLCEALIFLSTDGFNDVEGKHVLWSKHFVAIKDPSRTEGWTYQAYVRRQALSFISFSAHQSDKVHCAMHNLTTIVCNDSGDEGHVRRINIVMSGTPRTRSKSESLKKSGQMMEHFNPYNFIKKEARDSTVQTHENYSYNCFVSDLIEITNKARPCSRVHYSSVSKLLNMFRTTHRPPSGAQIL
jgi:hypothetical protein